MSRPSTVKTELKTFKDVFRTYRNPETFSVRAELKVRSTLCKMLVLIYGEHNVKVFQGEAGM